MANRKELDPLLTVSDVAHLLNVHINTVRRWSNQGILKTYRIGSRGDRRFQQEDIDNFLSQESRIAKVRRGGNLPLTDQALEGNNKLLADYKV